MDNTLLKESLGTNQFISFYGYGHTAEAAKIVREELKHWLASDKKKYDLKISVRTADSGYGGPRVTITTTQIELDRRYEYIIDENGEPADSGTLISKPCSEFPYGRPDYRANLVTPKVTEELNEKIRIILGQFGKDQDDAMTDYFDNTQPLFYGVSFEK